MTHPLLLELSFNELSLFADNVGEPVAVTAGHLAPDVMVARVREMLCQCLGEETLTRRWAELSATADPGTADGLVWYGAVSVSDTGFSLAPGEDGFLVTVMPLRGLVSTAEIETGW